MKTNPDCSLCPTLFRWIFRSSLFLAPLLGAAALAQAPGSIVGIVTDQATKGYLVGAEVRVAGSELTTATSREGAFSLSAVPAGSQKLEVSYLGRKTKTVTVLVDCGHSETPMRNFAALFLARARIG